MNSLTKTFQFSSTAFVLSLLVACGGGKTSEIKAVEANDTSTIKSVNIEKTPNTDKSTNTTGATMSNPIIKMETSKGTITLELDAKNAPLSTASFVSYVEDGFYDGIIFHRVIPNFMIQTGGMNPDMSEKPNKGHVQNEANNGLKNDRGTLAMARTPDPHSASSQFFVNLKDNDFLNFTSETSAGWGYAVFGKVTDGMDVVDEIAKVKTGNHGGHGDVPLEAVTIIKASVEK